MSERDGIELKADDKMDARIHNAFRYAGMPNPRGLVGAMSYIMSEYERLYGPVDPRHDKTEGQGDG